jgi:plasmid maintenance system antidote protein VapI
MKKKEHTGTELAEAHVYPNHTTAAEQAEFLRLRSERHADISPSEKLYNAILGLKYRLEAYIDSEEYIADHTFGYFLKKYIEILNIRQRDFAAAIDLDITYLNRIVNNAQPASPKLVYRLEYHSNHLIPALSWYKLMEKSAELALINDNKTKQEEFARVKKRADLRA